VVTVLIRCGLPLPTSRLADAKHRRCLTEKVSLPTIVSGRVLWHLGSTEEASAAALTQSYGALQRVVSQHEPSYQVKGVLIEGFDSTAKRLQTLLPGRAQPPDESAALRGRGMASPRYFVRRSCTSRQDYVLSADR
jgi:hypothetical protein